MYRKHFALTAFPFDLALEPEDLFPSAALTEAQARLKHLLELRGIGLVTGEAGSGKTTVCRKISAQLHPGLYRVFYVPLSTGNVMDMYKSIAWELGLPTERNRAAAFRVIRAEITRLTLEAKQRAVLIVDEAHRLRNDVLEDLRLLTNYEMDSDNRLCLLLVGLSELRRRLFHGRARIVGPTHRRALPPRRTRARRASPLPHPSPASGRLRVGTVRAARRRGPVPGLSGHAAKGQPPRTLCAHQRRYRQGSHHYCRACPQRLRGARAVSPLHTPFTLELPDDWTPQQALAVFELLNELTDMVWNRYSIELTELLADQLHQDDTSQPDLFDFDDSLHF